MIRYLTVSNEIIGKPQYIELSELLGELYGVEIDSKWQSLLGSHRVQLFLRAGISIHFPGELPES